MSDKDERILELERKLARTEGERDEARRMADRLPATWIAPYVCWCGVRHGGGHYHAPVNPWLLPQPWYPTWTSGLTVSSSTTQQTWNGDGANFVPSFLPQPPSSPSTSIALQLTGGANG
jgi:hypothetical protein